jgi:hypothetical protein
VRLSTDVEALTDSERKMIPHLVRAAEAMDRTYWEQAYGDKEKLLSSLESEAARRYAEINYGPWDRLDDNEPFVEGFEESRAPPLSRYDEGGAGDGGGGVGGAVERPAPCTMVRRDEGPDIIPQSVFSRPFAPAAQGRAGGGARGRPGLNTSSFAPRRCSRTTIGRNAKDNTLDIVIALSRPTRISCSDTGGERGFVLVKDREWSARLSRYAALLLEPRRRCPCLTVQARVPGSTRISTPTTSSTPGTATPERKRSPSTANDEEVQVERHQKAPAQERDARQADRSPFPSPPS